LHHFYRSFVISVYDKTLSNDALFALDSNFITLYFKYLCIISEIHLQYCQMHLENVLAFKFCLFYALPLIQEE
jgi:hypothetical protein